MTAARLEVQDATVEFASARGSVTAFRSVSFNVEPGEFCILLGPSGCGKTTLLMCIAGFQSLAAGRILLDGRPVGRPEPDRTVVFQEFDQLLAWKTVLENVAFAMRRARRVSGQKARATARQYLELTGLGAFGEAYPHTLSGGMKQRAAIARALALDPEVLLMDEPFGSLDAMTRQRMQVELHRIWETTRKTVIFVTHSVEEALVLGQRIVILSAHPGTVEAIVENPHPGPGWADHAGALALRSRINRVLGIAVGQESPAS